MLTKEAWAEDACNQSMTCGAKNGGNRLLTASFGPDLRICNSATLSTQFASEQFPPIFEFSFCKTSKSFGHRVFSTNDNVN